MKRPVYVYKPGTYVETYVNPAHDVGILQVEINEPLETLLKNDCHLVLKTDPPKPSVQEAPASDPVVPKTPLELCNLLSDLDSAHLGTIVGQLLVSKCVSLQRFQYVLGHSRRLVQASGKLRQELLNILENKPPEEEEGEDE